MFQNRDKLYQAYHTLLSMALCWALALVINQYYELRVPIFFSAFFSFFPAALIYLVDLNKKNTVTYIIVASMLPILALIFWARKFNPFLWLSGYGNWIVTYNGSEELYLAQYSNFTIFIIGFMAALIFFLLTKTQMFKVILAVVIMVAMIILSISEINIGKTVVAICIFYLLSILVEAYGIIYARKAGKQEKKESILYLAPICLMLAFIAIMLPSKPEPIQWKAVRYVYNNLKEQIEVWKTDLDYYFSQQESEFFVSLTGYSEDSKELDNSGGKLLKDEKVAMKVTGSTRNRAVYLIGSVSDIYTGRSWEKSREDYLAGEKEYLLDYAELVYALSRQNLEVLENNRFIERVTFKVIFNNIKTKTVFYPLKTSWFDMISGPKKPVFEPSNIAFEKVQGRGITYDTVYFEMNLQGEAFIQMLQDADAFSYDSPGSVKLESLDWLTLDTITRDKSDNFLSRRDFYELLRDRATLIEKSYTKLPEELPTRVKELAGEITAGCETTYDKMKAIESYLQEYTYTLTPGRVPKGEDFIDYFLFEGKQGYCTSFATAVAVLGRCVGVPTRYVEGFIAKFEVRDKDNMYPVRNSQAHAWSEAYIEGVGWIPFEATAPYYNTRYTKWAELSQEGQAGSNYLDLSEQYRNAQVEPFTGEIVSTEIENKDNGKDNMYDIIAGILIAVAAVLIVFLLLITYYSVLKYRYRKAYNNADYSRRMYLMFLRILTLLRQEGFTLENQETILMLAQRVKDHLCINLINFSEVAAIFMRYRYAEEAVTKKELEQVEIYQKGLALRQREKHAKLKLWLKEFAFLMKYQNA